jgi:orotate phosphoribosyltransferase
MSEPAWESARQQLIRLLREHAVQYGPATVASGTVTDVFIDTSRVTLLGRGLSLIESLLVPLLANDHVDAVGGPAMGAIPLVTLMARHQGADFISGCASRRLGGTRRSAAPPRNQAWRSPCSMTWPRPGLPC